jgi:hypothetical protein
VERKEDRPPGLERSLSYLISFRADGIDAKGSVYLFRRNRVVSTCLTAESTLFGAETALEVGVTRSAALSAASAVGAPGSTVLSAMVEVCIEECNREKERKECCVGKATPHSRPPSSTAQLAAAEVRGGGTL